MSVMGLFFILIFSGALTWLWRQGVMDAPWLSEGEVANFRGGAMPPSATKVGLVVFLAVAGCLFSLLVASFFMRQGSPDWQSPDMPGVLWLNTLALVASSVALQLGSNAAKRGDMDSVRTTLTAGALCAGLFLFGQIWAWRIFVQAGVYISGNPAASFFFLLTGAHALHLIGGLVALARVMGRAWDAPRQSATLSASVDLCALYWHFLLLVWALLFLMLSGRADGFGEICRRILS